jgi:predicted transcriptional regulator
MSIKIVDLISAAQCRGARGLLEISQTQLAKAARLSLSTIVDFEKSRRQVSNDAVRGIKAALEYAGVEFIEENGGGPGVRLRKRHWPRSSK